MSVVTHTHTWDVVYAAYNARVTYPLHIWIWDAFHAVAHVAASPYVVSTAIDTAKTLGALTIVLALLMVHPRTRRVTCTAVRVTNRLSPAWAKPAMVAAAFFPGQADEIVLVAILLWPILRNARKRAVFTRSVRYAWNYGR